MSLKDNVTAAELAKLILSLPVEIRALPVYTRDCDCGNDPHEVSSLYPERLGNYSIFLEPTCERISAEEIVSAYNKLKEEDEQLTQSVKRAVVSGVDIELNTSPPYGWDHCQLKSLDYTNSVDIDFDPKNNKNDLNSIIKFFEKPVRENAVNKNWFGVGYPGKRDTLPFDLRDLNIDARVIDIMVMPEEFPHDGYMHVKMHVKITFDYVPDLTYFGWEKMNVRYNYQWVYEFDDTVTFMISKQKEDHNENNQS